MEPSDQMIFEQREKQWEKREHDLMQELVAKSEENLML